MLTDCLLIGSAQNHTVILTLLNYANIKSKLKQGKDKGLITLIKRDVEINPIIYIIHHG